MKIATWNVNSLRARADRVESWLDRSDVDVLAIQETKCRDENFPWELFERRGYEVAHFGFSQWNGVAIASRVGLTNVERTFIGQPAFGKNGVDAVQEARALAATVGEGADALRLWSLYVPNGRALDDEHMVYKLQWLDALKDRVAEQLTADPELRIALTGDWNIAPQDEDVWDIQHFLDEGLTHVSAPERAAFHAFETAGFQDVVRPWTPGPGTYTYWDYKQLRFPKKQGMRIDFILASPALAGTVTGAWIDREERKGKGASDHAPVVVELGSEPAAGGTTAPAGT
ncbi:exodeoxyribonuclease III [Citricoccus sp. GCM10030269]|uniref:exodeoxyribonuclease III n=1 Tax=Citricoccus sp. GCM10030269 TaxID=3273388 RepID=UPI00360FF8C1